MLQTPLQLERSFIPIVEVLADPEHKRGEAQVNLKVEQGMSALDQEASRWQVDLDISVGAEPGSGAPPYRVHLHVVGVFSFAAPEIAEQERARIVGVTGASILYSQARELLLMMTSRGPWGAFQLPTVSFVDSSLAAHRTEAALAVRDPGPESGAERPPAKPRKRAAKRAPRRSAGR